ncbi:DUF969 domain-containing protein [Aerococcus sp. 1KP-2016]|uniref:DUF969 domain-containing protein n=1 Tax=Aerococcus sp. 1KP-2016 TaxID=1981982 RepID=UPI000B97FB3C|nr:DUF969 domain-containing protein [Aerococcus sp. 1KP-2016]OYQ65890.1 hypothetical protein B9P78_07295 [Aerococcus sp. 1KP-2016]
MSYLPLIGILIIIVGFAMKLDTIAVVVLAGLVTALVSGISISEFLVMLGEGFVKNRLVTIFILTLPMIGLAETYGLKHQAVRLINKMKGMTTGSFLTLYLFLRELAGFLSIRIGGHPQFVRPLVQPMAEAAAIAKNGEIDDASKEKIKAQSASVENIGNFYAQNTFVASAGTLLISGTLESLGYEVLAVEVARASIPVAIITFVITAIYNYSFDKRLNHKYQKGGK